MRGWSTITRGSLAGLVALSFLTGCAGFDPLGPQSAWGAAQSAVKGRGNVFVHVDEAGVATVDGWVDSRLSESAVLDALAARTDITDIVDRLRVERDPLHHR